MKTFVIICCGEHKNGKKTSASEMYISDRFLLSKQYASAVTNDWFVISGKHGILHPENVIDPYDFPLSELSPIEKIEWENRVATKILTKSTRKTRIIYLGTPEYFSGISKILSKEKALVFEPFKHLPKSGWIPWLKKNTDEKRIRFLNEFHNLIEKLKNREDLFINFNRASGNHEWAERGLYIFFDHESAPMNSILPDRIVRIGTHGVSRGSRSTLWQRLKSHQGTENGGNHRSSIFRSHVGAAMMEKDGLEYPTWGNIQSSEDIAKSNEQSLERRVSKYLGNLSVMQIPVLDPPSKLSDRAYLEQNMISLLSGEFGPIDYGDESWLGYHCPNVSVRKSSLWNVNHTEQNYDPYFLEVLDIFVGAALGKRKISHESIAPINWYQRSKTSYRQRSLGV